MKQSNVAARLKSAIQQSSKDCVVLVAKEYAKYFTAPPRDGRTYVVEDPHRKGVHHWTSPDGTYQCLEKRTYPYKVPGMPLKIHAKRIKCKPTMKKKGSRVASDYAAGALVQGASEAPPAISLIDINRVMRITGFKTSFIYERADFPQPVKLGETPRSPVRWVESEVFAWCEALLSKRDTSAVYK